MPWLVTNKSSKRTNFLDELGKCTRPLAAATVVLRVESMLGRSLP
jgi:hypothetical protein